MEGRNSSSGVDRFSNVPDDIMGTILGSLTTKENMRTTVLSKTWRHKWRLAPKFTINAELSTDQEKLSDIAHNVLCYHRGPVEKFSLSLQEVKNNEIIRNIDYIAFYLATKGVSDLKFKIEEGDALLMPLTLFLCENLMRLNLQRFVIAPPPGFRGFQDLVKLQLSEVLVEREALEGIIAGSRFLKKLTLKYLDDINVLNVNASALEAFYYEGVELRLLRFQAPILEDFVFKNEANEPRPANVLQGGIRVEGFPPKTGIVMLNGQFWKFVGMMTNLLQTRPNIFDKVYLFYIGETSFMDANEISCLLKLLQCAPNLKTLYVKGGREMHPNVEPIQAFWEDQENKTFSFGQLERVTLHDFLGSWSQLQFIELLLASSPLLESLVILPLSNDILYNDRVMTRRVMRYRRISPKAEVIFFPFS